MLRTDLSRNVTDGISIVEECYFSKNLKIHVVIGNRVINYMAHRSGHNFSQGLFVRHLHNCTLGKSVTDGPADKISPLVNQNLAENQFRTSLNLTPAL